MSTTRAVRPFRIPRRIESVRRACLAAIQILDDIPSPMIVAEVAWPSSSAWLGKKGKGTTLQCTCQDPTWPHQLAVTRSAMHDRKCGSFWNTAVGVCRSHGEKHSIVDVSNPPGSPITHPVHLTMF